MLLKYGRSICITENLICPLSKILRSENNIFKQSERNDKLYLNYIIFISEFHSKQIFVDWSGEELCLKQPGLVYRICG